MWRGYVGGTEEDCTTEEEIYSSLGLQPAQPLQPTLVEGNTLDDLQEFWDHQPTLEELKSVPFNSPLEAAGTHEPSISTPTDIIMGDDWNMIGETLSLSINPKDPKDLKLSNSYDDMIDKILFGECNELDEFVNYLRDDLDVGNIVDTNTDTQELVKNLNRHEGTIRHKLPTEFKVKDMTISRGLFAKAFTANGGIDRDENEAIISSTKVLFKALFFDEIKNGATYSARAQRPGLKKEKLMTILKIAIWMRMNRNANPYSFSPIEIESIKVNKGLEKLAERRVWIQKRNDLLKPENEKRKMRKQE